MKNAFWGYLFFSIFALAGIGCGALAFFSWQSRNRLLQTGIKTTGTVVELQHSTGKNANSVAPVVEFVTNTGDVQTYTSDYYTNISPFEVGEEVTLWYDAADPSEVTLDKHGTMSSLLPLIFLFTHGGVGIGGLVWLERKRRLKKWLLANGQVIQATFTEVRTGKRSFALRCEWTDPFTSERHTFESDWLSTNPYLAPGASVPVLIDPSKPQKRYWVDTSAWQ